MRLQQYNLLCINFMHSTSFSTGYSQNFLVWRGGLAFEKRALRLIVNIQPWILPHSNITSSEYQCCLNWLTDFKKNLRQLPTFLFLVRLSI